MDKKEPTLDALHDCLLIQCLPSQTKDSAEIAAEHHGGLVITGLGGIVEARKLRRSGFTGPILCDAGRYTGSKRRAAQAGISDDWCERQRTIGGIALTDSGFIDAGETAGLRNILTGAARQPAPTIALLPLAQGWLRTLPYAKALVAEIADHGVPVAVAIEHDNDPLGQQQVLAGFLEVLAAPVPVLLLRADVSALGALCHGAHAAAVGTATNLRHIYPRKPSGGPPPRIPQVSAFVRHLLCYRSLDVIAAAVQETPDETDIWQCQCGECLGRSLDRLATIEDGTEQVTRAFRHSLHGLFETRHGLLTAGSTPEDRRKSWHEHCQHALFEHTGLKRTLRAWRTPGALRAWAAAPPPAQSSPIP